MSAFRSLQQPVFYFLFALGLGVPAEAQDEMRAWKDATGREIRASIDGFQDIDTIILKLPDGRTIPYPIKKLSPDDIVFATKAYEDQAANVDIDWENPKESEEYVIRNVSRDRAPGYVLTKSGWQNGVKCVQVKLQYKGNQSNGKGNVKAYFYNRDGKLIDTVNKPPRRQDEDNRYINAPVDFKKNDLVEAYFPLTEFLEESDWATVLVVFGNGSEYSFKTMPGGSLEKLDFAEKKMAFPAWEPAQGGGNDDKESMSNVDLEIRRFKEEKHGSSLSFNGDYQSGKLCMSAEVRATGEIAPGDGSVKLHYFNEAGKLMGTRNRPSSAALVSYETYVQNPRIANDSWHPVFFALDGELEEKDFPTFVLVFTFGGKTAAMVESSAGATLESLNFPEKSKLSQ